MERAGRGAIADGVREIPAARAGRRGPGSSYRRVGRSRQPLGRRLSHAGAAGRTMDGARLDRRRTDGALACRGVVDDDAERGGAMTLLKSATYGTEAARDQWVPRGLANTHP